MSSADLIKDNNSKSAESENLVLKALGMTACGFLFGFVMQKGQVSPPLNIAMQFTFEKFTMIKMFLSAAATSLVVQSAMAIADPAGFYKTREPSNPSLFRIILGGSILGAGMAIGGSCPGNIYVQLGAFVQNAGYIISGALTGSVLFYVVDEVMDLFQSKSKLKCDDECEVNEPTFIEKSMNLSYPVVSISMAVILSGIIGGIEYLVPWQSDLAPGNQWDSGIYNPLVQKSWPPWVAGVGVGLLQVPVRYLSGEGLGSATTTYGLVSTVFEMFGLNTKFSLTKSTFAMLQFFYIAIGTVGGAVFSSMLSGQFNNPELIPGLSPLRGFIGGILMLFGARIAGGCTSGHGITGFTNLNVGSLINVMAMFGMAIVVGMSIKALA